MKPKSITHQALRNAGLRYLERYAASTQSLRDVLKRRISKVQHSDSPDPCTLKRWIDDIIEQFTNEENKLFYVIVIIVILYYCLKK